jgi:hypothetical protein
MMAVDQNQALEKIRKLQEKTSKAWVNYWHHYSNTTTWQFWVNLSLLILPLVALYMFIDRRRVFHIGFYGFNVHVWFNYIDLLGTRFGLWEFPYRTIPFFPVSLSLDASLVPVVFMLVYQWTLNHSKNYYLFLTGVCAFFAFVLKPLMSVLDLFQLYKWMNFFYLFLVYVIVMLLSRWVTNFFIHLQKTAKDQKM